MASEAASPASQASQANEAISDPGHRRVEQRSGEDVAAAGWFGKLPALGDFATRRLPDVFVHEWDDWLQHGLAAAYESLIEVDLPTRDVPPIRRFWLGRGVLGPSCWTGLLMPSVDRVGRRFPLTVAVPALAADPQPASLAAALQARDWFAHVDALMREALDAALSVDEFEARLAELGTGLIALESASEATSTPGTGAQHETPWPPIAWLPVACGLLQPFAPAARGGEFRRRTARAVEPIDHDRPEVDIALAAEALPCSVWWLDGAERAEDYLCYGALPPASELGPLLVGAGAFGAN